MVALLTEIPSVTGPDRHLANVGADRPRRPTVAQDAMILRPTSGPSRTVLLRRRIVAVGLLAISLLCIWIGPQAALGRIGGGPLATTGAPGGPQPATARVWIVRPGDTLWSIAESVDPRGDVRPLVDRFDAQIGGTTLYPGETIVVPSS